MLKDVLDQLGSLTLEEKRAVKEAARAAVARELGAQGGGGARGCVGCRKDIGEPFGHALPVSSECRI